jgi:CubicO group peptidase (beta-lactamase class C family)
MRGVAVGVLRGDRSWFVGSGTAGPGRPSPPLADTIFEIGSVTKVFTATLLAALVEDGSVTLQDPVQKYLPADVALARAAALTRGTRSSNAATLGPALQAHMSTSDRPAGLLR